MAHPSSLVIGVVGKPSVGKSTFFNSVSDGKNAKMGAFPFTTIEPNVGVTYYRTPCASFSRGKSDTCTPRFGRLDADGTRFIPVKLLDVAGLVPGASQGLGLGNKFLSDLCGADVLIHVIDVSGTTDSKGEATVGYDPVDDAEWLIGELTEWVFANLWSKWPSTVRKHHGGRPPTGKTAPTDIHPPPKQQPQQQQPHPLALTLGQCLNGYGGNKGGFLMHAVLDSLAFKDPVDLSAWGEAEVRSVVGAFVAKRFPMVLLLNKADPGALANVVGAAAADTDRNITKVSSKYEGQGMPCVVGSAAAENFLQSCVKQGYVEYRQGSDSFSTLDDVLEDIEWQKTRRLKAVARATAVTTEPGGDGCSSPAVEGREESAAAAAAVAAAEAAVEAEADVEAKAAVRRLKPLPTEAQDPKMGRRLERLRDSVFYRFGGTGVWRAVQAAVDLSEPAVAFPVRSLTSFTTAATFSCAGGGGRLNAPTIWTKFAASGDAGQGGGGSGKDGGEGSGGGSVAACQEEDQKPATLVTNLESSSRSSGIDGSGDTGSSDTGTGTGGSGGAFAATNEGSAAINARASSSSSLSSNHLNSSVSHTAGSAAAGGSVFADCFLLRKGTTVRQLGGVVLGGGQFYGHAEGEDGRRLPDDHVIQGKDFVCRFSANRSVASLSQRPGGPSSAPAS
mmetsp:Transcript_28807/g.58877  ORF Transcript_28807/g.58877 Transcript_28807/m.58877 type:complete len:674 (-) Transcript_28807:141-2162(-)|eukprot:CAMPEP_0171759718 /NCGR_PEP_ID=MMETSP0991-20121206/47052_1 /TAXON_ID=483369 /ORGANISM="non described non described, Strain CCMP2098" /LENGTH=673 /DNA_ID=CAMNT_0012362693 /DNA_START=40 /DNA_END=2061 /DNA_ORIENTATION=+